MSAQLLTVVQMSRKRTRDDDRLPVTDVYKQRAVGTDGPERDGLTTEEIDNYMRVLAQQSVSLPADTEAEIDRALAYINARMT